MLFGANNWSDQCFLTDDTIITTLDYCNALYVKVSQVSLSRLQLVLNATACPLIGDHGHEHITYCLLVHYKTCFKIPMFAFECLHGLAPSYLSHLLQLYVPSRTLRSADQLLLNVTKN